MSLTSHIQDTKEYHLKFPNNLNSVKMTFQNYFSVALFQTCLELFQLHEHTHNVKSENIKVQAGLADYVT